MSQFEKKLRNKNIVPRILGGFLTIFLAIVIAFGASDEFMSYITAEDYIFDYPIDMMDPEQFYCVDNNVLYDCYAEDDEGYYYITSAGNSSGDFKYMGYYVYKAQSEEADKVMEATWNALENDEGQPLYLEGKGYVYEMSRDEANLFKIYMAGAGVDVSMCEYKTIALVPLGKAIKGYSVLGLLVGIAVLVLGMWLIISFFLGSYKKQLKKDFETFSVSMESLDSDMSMAEKLNGIFFGRKYIVPAISKPWVIPYDRLIWAYKTIQRTRHTLYGIIPTGTTKSYSISLVSSDGKFHQCSMRSEEKCDETLEKLSKIAPYVLYGYSEEIDELCSNNFSRAVSVVDERRANNVGTIS